MKARITSSSAERIIPGYAKDAVKAYVDEQFKQRQKIYTRRILLAMCIALNDILHLGDKRLMWILKGIEDITQDYAGRVDKGYRAEDGKSDKVSELMQEELLSRRGIHIVIK